MKERGGASTDPIEAELVPGERVLWRGRPDPSRLFCGRDAFLVPFSVMWAGFAVFWEIGVLKSGAGLFFALWGLPFIAMGAFITVGRFIVKRVRKQRTWYAVTSERLLIVEHGRRRVLREWAVADVRQTELRPRAGGGDLVLDGGNFVSAMYANTGMDALSSWHGGAPFAFYDVPDVEQAKAALDRARSGLRPPSH